MSANLILAGLGTGAIPYIANRMRIAMVRKYWEAAAALQTSPPSPQGENDLTDSEMVAIYRAAHMSEKVLNSQNNANVTYADEHKTITVKRRNHNIVFNQIIHKNDRESSFAARVYVEENGERVLFIPKGLDKLTENNPMGVGKDYWTVGMAMLGFITKQDYAARQLLTETLYHAQGKNVIAVGYSLGSMLVRNALRHHHENPPENSQAKSVSGYVFADLGPTATLQDTKNTFKTFTKRMSAPASINFGHVKELRILLDPLAAFARAGSAAPGTIVHKAKKKIMGHLTRRYLKAAQNGARPQP